MARGSCGEALYAGRKCGIERVAWFCLESAFICGKVGQDVSFWLANESIRIWGNDIVRLI